MIFHIIKKEILQGTFSLRFPLMLILIAVVMISAAVLFLEDYRQQMADYDANVKDNLHRLYQRANEHPFSLAFVFSYNHQWVYRATTKLAFLAEGREKYLPNAFQVNAFTITGPVKKLRSNDLLRWSEDLNWAFVISMVMSFLAIVLVYDSISGERENGTLRLSMSNSVPRSTIIAGKYLSLMIILIAPLLTGILLSLIVIGISGEISFTRADWARIGIAAFLSILYLSVFVTLGLFISSLLRSSATALVILLLTWTLMAVVIPGVGGIITMRMAMSNGGIDRINAYAARDEAFRNYIARHPDTAPWQGGVWSPRDSLGKHLYGYDALMKVYSNYYDEMVRQVKFGYSLIRISPTAVYQSAMESVTGSGVDHYESFMKQVHRYRLALQESLISLHPGDIHRQYDDREIRAIFPNLKLTASAIPKFQDEPVLLEASMQNSLWDIAILAIFNIFFFMAAYVSFLRRDVR